MLFGISKIKFIKLMGLMGSGAFVLELMGSGAFEEFVLEQNYPNPFNPTTKISFSIPSAGNYSLKVYDILGKEVASLVEEYKIAGNYEVVFNASNLPSGMYIYRLQGQNINLVKKMMLIK